MPRAVGCGNGEDAYFLDKMPFSWHVAGMKKLRILAIIPARGGSKGIPLKNIRLFGGKPLLAHTIDAARKNTNIDRIVVSTDNLAIARVAKKFGVEVVPRPAKFASDKSQIIDAILYTLDTLKAEGYEPTHVLLLQPTNPMRTSDDITRAVSLLTKRKADSVVSVCRTENMLLTKNKRDELRILNPDTLSSANRQELGEYYKLDGCMIYLTSVPMLREKRSFFAGKLVGYEIERWRAVDIDEPQDFVIGELIFNNRSRITNALKKF